jgi:transcriptional regulator of acetoin/glycerol metabolism
MLRLGPWDLAGTPSKRGMMSDQPVTLRDSVSGRANAVDDGQPLPGLLQVFTAGEPRCVVLPIPKNAPLEVGRGDGKTAMPTDPRMSRRHATVWFDGERFRVQDQGSQNGTYIDGVRLQNAHESASSLVLRVGDSLFLFCGDLRRYQKFGMSVSADRVVGPALQEVLSQTNRAAQYGHTLHITGESGSGKEGVARAFHDAHKATGAFVPINCATIAPGVAERLLFGAKRGAFSGAVSDSEGLIQSADGGTLFLDEVAELDLSVQAKLLRVIETREVLAMGALRSRPVSLHLCTASHRNLRHEVSHGRFREDLYFRVASPSVAIPSLRHRLDEIPWLIQLAVRTFPEKLAIHALFVEQCLFRKWPGNVRELLAETRASAQLALGQDSRRLEANHLAPHAGQPLEHKEEPLPPCAVLFTPPACRKDPPDRNQIEDTLRRTDGNISATARLLGLHRTQLKRLLTRYGISGINLAKDQTLDEEDSDS